MEGLTEGSGEDRPREARGHEPSAGLTRTTRGFRLDNTLGRVLKSIKFK